VCVFLRGAVDGLAMIVPHGEPLYYRERPRIAISPGDVIDLDGRFGLHPALAPLLPWWRSRELAVVHAVGFADSALRHGAAQDRLARLLRGAPTAPALHRPESAAGTPPPARAAYPDSTLGRSLAVMARLIRADVGLTIGRVDVGGWDTHVSQGATGGRLGARLAELARGLAAFAGELGSRMRDVVVATMSEFGRTVRENGVGGTDHGRATAMLALGGPVNGGRVLGEWPGLRASERSAGAGGNGLAVTTDFRDVFGELLVRHLGAKDLGPAFPGYDVDAARFRGVLRVQPASPPPFAMWSTPPSPGS
jgi:uncharacterized protein (DUF1501 family)